MENGVHDQGDQTTSIAEQKRPEINWTESDWFQVWLRLAKRDYHGRLQVSKGKSR